MLVKMIASYLEAEKGFHRINDYCKVSILKEVMRKKLFKATPLRTA
ncbi:hypothetical protein [Neomoorella humiferrea]